MDSGYYAASGLHWATCYASGGTISPEANLSLRSVRRPVLNEILKWVNGHTSQEACPWNVTFASPLIELTFKARPLLDGVHAVSLSRRLLPLSHHEFTAAFRGSPMQRAKRRGLVRYAAVVLGKLGGASDVELLSASLAD